MATQAERREHTRAALIDASATCLIEQGLANYTIGDVLERSGLSNGALYRYFPTRADLIAATVETMFGRARERYERDMAACASDERTFEASLRVLWSALGNPEVVAVYDTYTAARTDPELGAAVTAVMLPHLELASRTAMEAMSGVGLAPEITNPTLKLAVYALVGLAVRQSVVPDPDGADELIATLMTLAQTYSLDAASQPA